MSLYSLHGKSHLLNLTLAGPQRCPSVLKKPCGMGIRSAKIVVSFLRFRSGSPHTEPESAVSRAQKEAASLLQDAGHHFC